MTKEQELLNEAKQLIEKAKELIANTEKLMESTEKEGVYFDLVKEFAGNLSGNGFMCIMGCGEYSGISFYLYDYYKWELKKDSFGKLCLIPTKKLK